MNLAERNARNQRLVILRALEREGDGRLNETLLAAELDLFGHSMSRDQVREQLRWLEDAGAITVVVAGGAIMIATITRRGEDHVARRGQPIEGVDLPSRL